MDIPEVQRELRSLAGEISAIQDEYLGKEMPAETHRAWKRKVERAAELKDRIEAHHNSRQVVGEPIMPTLGSTSDGWHKGGVMDDHNSKSAGEAFASSAALRDYLAAGAPQAPSGKALVPSFYRKAVPTIGTGVVRPVRDPDVARQADELVPRLRSVLQVVPTTSNAVEYVRITSALPATAAPVAPSGLKPESTMGLDVATAPVRVLAAWMPVTEQQLSDFPQIQAIVDDELRFDIARLEDYQIIWGDGTGENLLGIMNTSGVTAATRVPDLGAGSVVTLLDKIRVAVTDIAVAGHEANAVVIHPEDAEALALGKGADEHYLALAMAIQGRVGVWGLNVIETPAATKYRAATTTDQRVVIVGDFRRGATLWDRQQSTVAVGYIDDQFVRNQRTLRAEERVAFAVRRPSAFKYIETVAEVA